MSFKCLYYKVFKVQHTFSVWEVFDTNRYRLVSQFPGSYSGFFPASALHAAAEVISLKKVRNFVIGGIENKIFNLILAAILLMFGVFAAVALTQNKMLTRLTNETNNKQVASMTKTTAEVIDTVIEVNMVQNTEFQAQVIDNLFQNLAIQVQMVAAYAGELLSDPDSAPRGKWSRPDGAHNGELFAKILLAEGVKESDVSDELGLLANMSDMMVSVCTAYGADNVWFSLPDGVTMMADTVAGRWINDDGSYVTYEAPDRYWFKQAAEAKKMIFTDVEIDKRTGKMCVTCAMPVYNAQGDLLGVAGADLYLTELQRQISSALESGGLLLVVNQNGHVILAPREMAGLEVLRSKEASDLRNSSNMDLASLVTDALKGKSGLRRVPFQDDTYYMTGVLMDTVGWAMISAYSVTDAEQPVRTLQENYHEIQDDAISEYRIKEKEYRTISMIIMAVVLVLLFAGAITAGKRIVKPLNGITRQISELRNDNLEFKMKDAYRTGDEVELLAQSFADLSHKTVEYISQVRKVTAEKERIGTELHVAKQIQEGMLPGIFPAFPDRLDFDLYATMNPAKEVGGDFYDFFLIDGDHLGLVIADVSGKGVPAALFMMVSKAILKNNALMGKSAGEILSAANNIICSNNKMEMFVTIWLGILTISTGKIVAANAGHEYPAICRSGGNFELYRDQHNFVVGGFEGIRYKEYELALHPGDKLFLYTDGVPEATNSSEELYGTERMIEALNRKPGGNPKEILTAVRRSVDAFVDKADQFDDLTMLCLEYIGDE